MGVWIETYVFKTLDEVFDVTPYVGVWIETLWDYKNVGIRKVTPYVGVWIETSLLLATRHSR